MPGTSVKEALFKWQAENPDEQPATATFIKLIGQLPPIERMDATISTFLACEKLSLSSNALDKIGNLTNLKNLRILSLSRNGIKSLSGLEAVGETLEQLWMSYNQVEKLRGIVALQKLKVFYITWNKVSDWSELIRLAELPCLVELNFLGNPLAEKYGENVNSYRDALSTKIPNLETLDGDPIVR